MYGNFKSGPAASAALGGCCSLYHRFYLPNDGNGGARVKIRRAGKKARKLADSRGKS